MNLRRYAFVVVLALAAPVAAAASPINIVQFDSDADDGDGEFDPGGASGYDGLLAPDRVFVDGSPVYLESCGPIHCDFLALDLTWTVGPLLDFVLSVDPSEPWYVPGMGTYTYGPGTLTVDGNWHAGPDEPGILIASITSLVIELNHTGLFGIGGTTRAELGEGVLAESLARVLGVGQRILGGSYGIDTDGAYFFGNQGFGLGDNYGPGLEILVPEPTSLTITALGLLAVAVRRRAVRRGPGAN